MSEPADELWRLLDACIATLRTDPLALLEPEERLQASRINDLAAAARLRGGRIFDWKVVRDDRDQVCDRLLVVQHPGSEAPIEVLLWTGWDMDLDLATGDVVEVAAPGCGSVDSAAVESVMAHLRAWRHEREFDLGVPPGTDWYTLGVLTGEIPTTRIEEKAERARTGTLSARLRAACARLGLAPWFASQPDTGRAAQAWLVSTLGKSDSEARHSSVVSVIAALDRAVEAAPKPPAGPGTDRTSADDSVQPSASGRLRLDLDEQGGRHLLLNDQRMTYARGNRGGQLTLRHRGARFLVDLALHRRACHVSPDVLTDLRTALRRATDGEVTINLDGAEYVISHPMSVSTRLAKASGRRETGLRR